MSKHLINVDPPERRFSTVALVNARLCTIAHDVRASGREFLDRSFLCALRSVSSELQELEATALRLNDEATVGSLHRTAEQVRASVEALARMLWITPASFPSIADWHSEFSRH